MAVFTATAGTAFDAVNFGFYQGESEGPVQQTDSALNWATADLDSFRLFQTLWFDNNGDAENRPHQGDYLMGRVDYDVILNAPVLRPGLAELTVQYDEVTTARFVDLVTNQNVGTLTQVRISPMITAYRVGEGVHYDLNMPVPVSGLFYGDDVVTLGDLADNFVDPQGALLVRLGGGDDTLTARGGGADTVFGGAGDDLIRYQGNGHLIHGGDGDDTVRYLGSAENDFVPSRIDGGAGSDSLQGTYVNDVFIEGAGSGDDTLDGSFGVDMISYAAAGAGVVVDVQAGTATGGSGDDRFSAIERVAGSRFADTLLGSEGNETLLGNAGDDLLMGGFGGDGLAGGAGRDTVSYANSSDAVTVSLTTGTGTRGDAQGDALTLIENVSGSLRSDKIAGDARANVLDGGAGGRDTLFGMGGDDRLFGLLGDDRMDGGYGDDVLFGGAGADILAGGIGRDRFVFTSVTDSTARQTDTITDFSRTPGDRDLIDLRAIDAVAATLTFDDAFVVTALAGAGEFTGTAGEMRLIAVQGGTEVQVDVTGDGVADMLIFAGGGLTLTAQDFLL